MRRTFHYDGDGYRTSSDFRPSSSLGHGHAISPSHKVINKKGSSKRPQIPRGSQFDKGCTARHDVHTASPPPGGPHLSPLPSAQTVPQVPQTGLLNGARFALPQKQIGLNQSFPLGGAAGASGSQPTHPSSPTNRFSLDFESAQRAICQDPSCDPVSRSHSDPTYSLDIRSSPPSWHPLGSLDQSWSHVPHQTMPNHYSPRQMQPLKHEVPSQSLPSQPMAHSSIQSASAHCSTGTNAIPTVLLTSPTTSDPTNSERWQPFGQSASPPADHNSQLLHELMISSPPLQGPCDTSPGSPQESESQGSGDSQGDTGEQDSQDSQGSQGSQGSQSSQGFQGSQGSEGYQGSQLSKRSKGSKANKTAARAHHASTRSEGDITATSLNALGAMPPPTQIQAGADPVRSSPWRAAEDRGGGRNEASEFPEALPHSKSRRGKSPEDPLARGSSPDSLMAANPDSHESADSPAEWKETGSDSGYWSSGSGSSKRSQESSPNGWNGHFIGAFSDWGLSSWLAQALYKLNYEQPTPIQSEVMPCILQRYNVVVSELHPCTGKTSACVIAAMQLINWDENVPQALLLASTRELAQYTYQLVLKLGETACNGRGARERCCLLVGKTRVRDSVKSFENGGKAVVVATTGRLYDLMRRGVLRTDTVTLTILDEADAILQHLLIPKLVALLPEKMHWAILCARRTPHVDSFVTENMKDVKYIEARSLVAPDIEHLVVMVADLDEKVKLVDKICDAVLSGRMLIFCSVASRKALDQHLKEKYVPLETNRENVTGYSAPTVSIFIASDALARGISMANVAVVINLGLPPNSITYVQRAGRCCGSNQMAHVVVVNMVEAEELATVSEVEKVCGIHLIEVSWERAVLQCTLACNVSE